MITKKNAKEMGLEFVGFTTVWNFHNTTLESVVCNKKSKIFETIQKLKNEGYTGYLTFYVESIGRSAHSASRVAVYKHSVKDYGIRGSKRHAEFFIK